MPDFAVGVDIITKLLNKFLIYAALKVPELWIYDGEKLSFYELSEKTCHQIPESQALPLLSAEKLIEFLEMSRRTGQTDSLKNFRRRLGKQKSI